MALPQHFLHHVLFIQTSIFNAQPCLCLVFKQFLGNFFNCERSAVNALLLGTYTKAPPPDPMPSTLHVLIHIYDELNDYHHLLFAHYVMYKQVIT